MRQKKVHYKSKNSTWKCFLVIIWWTEVFEFNLDSFNGLWSNAIPSIKNGDMVIDVMVSSSREFWLEMILVAETRVFLYR